MRREAFPSLFIRQIEKADGVRSQQKTDGGESGPYGIEAARTQYRGGASGDVRRTCKDRGCNLTWHCDPWGTGGGF
jgi:hypothetical protein